MTVHSVVEYFLTLGKSGRRKSYYNSREGTYEDYVETYNGMMLYRLLGHIIAVFDGKILSLSPSEFDYENFETYTTWKRFYLITYYGNVFGYKLPLEPRLRVTRYGTSIYWHGEKGFFIPQYPLRINVSTGEILSKVYRVIPTYFVPPSRSKRQNAIIEKKDGYYILKDGKQYMVRYGIFYRLEEGKGMWIEEPIENIKPIIEYVRSKLA